MLLVAAIVALVTGLSTFMDSLLSKLLIPLAIVLFVIFGVVELRSASPVINLRFFTGNRNYAYSNIAALFNYSATFGLSYLLSVYLQVTAGFSSGTAGIILICQPVVMAVISPFMGRTSDRISPFVLATIGMGICTVAVLIFTFIQVTTPLAIVIVGLLVMGLGIGVFSSPNTNAVMSCVSMRDAGVASSLLNTMRSLGQTTSLAIVTLVTSAQLGTASFTGATPNQLVAMSRTCFIVFLVLSVVAVFLSMQRKTSGDKPAAH